MELTHEAIEELTELAPDVIDALSVARAKKKDAEQLEEQLTLKIKELMAEAETVEYAPRRSQLKLVIHAVPTAQVLWKEEWEKLARSKWGSRWVEVLAKLKRRYTSPVIKLGLELNEKHGELLAKGGTIKPVKGDTTSKVRELPRRA